nr:putative late blight resistance protein homolog R1B-14 [Ipomoea batatas]
MDAVVELVISKVAQSVKENETLILGIKDQVEDLVRELISFHHVAYLYMVAGNEKCNDNALLEDVVKKIQKVGTDAEDAIDKYVVERREHRGRGVLMKWGEKVSYYAKVNEAAKEMESIKKRAEKIGVDLAHSLQGGSLNNPQPPLLRFKVSVVEEDEVVGFDDEVQTIKDRVIKGSKDTTFISIVGMGGLGKTTLMKMVFNDSEIHYDFFPRIWVYVSRSMNRREINGARMEGNDNYRRLCVRSSLKDFIGSEEKPSGEHIRSLLTSHKLDVPKEHLATIPKSYPFLKVFDAESLKFEILPKEFYQLYQLRYWAISTENNIIPKLFTHLWNLQTLMFNTTSSTVDVKAEIWNMPKLRHILSNASLQLPHPNSESCKENSSSSCPELQTLSTISPKSCTEEIFDKTPNLQKLGVRGNVSELLESKESGGICLFDNIRKLEKLENLKLMHEAAFNDEAAATTLRSIPQGDRFPRNLRKLTLSKTSFDWKDICALGSLDKLEVLKLEEFSAKGESWELNVNVVFKSLRFLRIGRTDLVYWTCEQSSFPALKRLQILQCEQLKEVPLSFKDVKSLKIIDLFFTNKEAANSARNIRDQKPKLDNFVLSILPPHH